MGMPRGFAQNRLLQHVMAQSEMMKQAFMEGQIELGLAKVEGESLDGTVRAEFNGRGDFLKIKIDPGFLNPDDPDSVTEEQLREAEESLNEALSDGHRKAMELSKRKLNAVSARLGMGGFDFD